MAARFDCLFCRCGSSGAPSPPSTWQLPLPSRLPAACGDAQLNRNYSLRNSLNMSVQKKQRAGRTLRRGGVAFARKDGGSRKDGGVVSGAGLVLEGSSPDQALHTKFVEELSERVEMLLSHVSGKSPEDYKRRAELFHRISEIFVAHRNSEHQTIESDSFGDPDMSSESKHEILLRGKNFAADEMDEVLILEDLVMERDEGTRADDYNRRAAIFGWSAELVSAKTQDQTTQDSSRHQQEIRHFEDVLVLQTDTGRAASDYSRRAATFGKNSELFVAASHKQAEKKRAAQERVNSSTSSQ